MKLAVPFCGARPRRGLSLVELMVGIAVGLFIVAAATVMTSSQLGENRRLLIESQLQQDLRTTTDIITRELRRSGSMLEAELLISNESQSAAANPQAPTTPASAPTGSPVSQVTFKYQRSGTEQGPWGYKLEGGVIKTLVTEGTAWQDLTDGNVMTVTAFAVNINRQDLIELPCPKLCPAGNTACWPALYVREFEVSITAQARNYPEVRRSVRTRVRPRNDLIEFRTGTPQACPA